MSRINVDAAGLRILRDHALKVGTLQAWSDMALEYAEAAEKAVLTAQQARAEAEEIASRLRFPDTTGR